MQENDLQLRSVNELLKDSFFVPAYQRGYRWTARQVTDLLEDVFAFMNEGRRAKGEFYCLQPVVVARGEKHWELIDGQQRLTSIYLVLSFFNSRLTEEFRRELFSLDYKTRDECADYLRSLDEAGSHRNIDFFHIWQAYQAIREWFKDRANKINDMESAFLNDVKVIWYEVRGDVDPIAVFSRLNLGKIPLTNAELVKALFLRAGNFEREGPRARHLQQLKIAQDWDEIERRLQDDAFWFFLTNAKQEANRIDFVLRLRAAELGTDPALRRDPSFLFLAFNEHLTNKPERIAEEWDSVKRVFLLLDEWFRDRYSYHVIGFLITQGIEVPTIRKLASDAASKMAYRDTLKELAFKSVFVHAAEVHTDAEMRDLIASRLVELHYETNADKKIIRQVLLLFNIVSMLENGVSGPRFPFDHFKKDRWDLEHIRSVKSNMPIRKDDQKTWLGNVLEYLSVPETVGPRPETETQEVSMTERLLALRDAEPFDSTAFAALFESVIDLHDPGSDPEADHSIGNLTLLDATTNRSYGNAIFPHKRRKLIALDKVGKFVPLCTKNAFLKYYSPKIDEMLIWTRNDATAHQAAMVESLTNFFVTEGSQR